MKNISLKTIAFLFIYALQPFAIGQISVESKVDRSAIFIGDIIKYSVLITHDPDVELQSPSLAANLGSFEIRDYKVLDPVKENEQIISQTDYLISTFVTGEFDIPALEIIYKTTDDTTLKTIKTEPITILVKSLNPDEAGDIRDIKPPLEPPRDYRQLILWTIIGIAIVALVFTAFYYVKRRREGKSFIPKRSKPPRPAHEIALEALDRLSKRDLLKDGKIKQYYVELSDIIRNYIEARYYIIAPEMTTNQLLDKMLREQINADHLHLLREILDNSDIVKFAKYIPSERENQETTELAFEFVNKTKLVIEPDAEITELKESEAGSVAQDMEEESQKSMNDSATMSEGEVIKERDSVGGGK